MDNDNPNVVPMRINLDDPLATELIDWLTDRGMPVSDARQVVKRTLKRLMPLRGMSLRVKLVPESNPDKTINLSETLTQGISQAVRPLVHDLAHDRIGLEYRLWRSELGLMQ